MATGPENRQPIIIKRVKKIAAGHHGGAWKVAYADFVTAMMAFFLLLWLLNATSEAQKQGIADYFDPMSVSESTSGAGGVLGGQNVTEDGNTKSGGPPTVVTNLNHKSDPEEKPPVDQPPPEDVQARQGMATSGDKAAGPNSSAVATPAPGQQMAKSEQTATQASGGTNVDAGIGAGSQTGGLGTGPQAGGLAPTGQMTLSVGVAGATGTGGAQADARAAAQTEALRKAEEQKFQAVAQTIRQEVQKSPDLSAVAGQVLVDSTPEGLRIQLVDQPDKAMFMSGSSRMSPELIALLAKISAVIGPLDNRVSVAGHTDSAPYRNTLGYTNWELSSDRANAARRVLVEDGLRPARLYQVSGKADSEPLIPDNPRDAANRRITITLMREVPVLPPGITLMPATP